MTKKKINSIGCFVFSKIKNDLHKKSRADIRKIMRSKWYGVFNLWSNTCNVRIDLLERYNNGK